MNEKDAKIIKKTLEKSKKEEKHYLVDIFYGRIVKVWEYKDGGIA